MELINVADLTFKSNAEIIEMILEALQSLKRMKSGDPEHEATMHSIRIMRRELFARRMREPKF